MANPPVNLADLAIEAVLACWFLACVVLQCSQRLSSWHSAPHMLFLCSRWRLFAPRPIDRDYEVRRRFELSGGALTAWQPLIEAHRPRGAWIWHPQLLRRLVIANVGIRFDRGRTPDVEPEGRLVGEFTRWVKTIGVPPQARRVQYRLTSSRASELTVQPAVVFESPLMDL